MSESKNEHVKGQRQEKKGNDPIKGVGKPQREETIGFRVRVSAGKDKRSRDLGTNFPQNATVFPNKMNTMIVLTNCTIVSFVVP